MFPSSSFSSTDYFIFFHFLEVLPSTYLSTFLLIKTGNGTILSKGLFGLGGDGFVPEGIGLVGFCGFALSLNGIVCFFSTGLTLLGLLLLTLSLLVSNICNSLFHQRLTGDLPCSSWSVCQWEAWQGCHLAGRLFVRESHDQDS